MVEKNKVISEESAMGAGAVVGAPSLSGSLEEEKDYQTSVKSHHSGYKSAMIDHGNQTKGSEPFTVKPNMKRSKSAPPLGEDFKMTDKAQIDEELTLRKAIRNFIKEEKSSLLKESLEESKLRGYIRTLLKEEKSKVEKEIPYDSTGINVLEDLLKKVLPIVETDFKSLTSDPAQRESFRAHILTSIQNTLMPSILTKHRERREDSPAESPEMELEDKELDVTIGSDTVPMTSPDPTGFIDISKKKPHVSSFVNLPDQDETGKNMALKTFDKIEKSILEAYEILANEEDEQLFYDYLITNLKLYCEKWSDELSSSVEEPTTPEYEKTKDDIEQIKSQTDPDVASDNPVN